MSNRASGGWRWLAPVLVMALIFAFSSVPGQDLPNLGILDLISKKGAHMLIYGTLAVAFWYAQGWRRERRSRAWLLAVLYAVTDELHQHFVPGRHPWWLDVALFDAVGALLGLWLAGKIRERRAKTQTPQPLP